MEKRLADQNDPYHRVIVTESNGSVVGFASYGNNLEDDPLYQGEIYALYILNEFRKQGLGRRLVSRAASALMELNIASLIIWVLSENPDRRFYERMGGKYLYEKPGLVGGVLLNKVAYGWEDLGSLVNKDE
jgi:ribosomal protein S18 acetylase RimI-like enzyme